MPFDVTVPTGRLWVLGDYRDGSADSRYHLDDHDGTIPASAVVAVVVWIDRPKRDRGPAPVATYAGG